MRGNTSTHVGLLYTIPFIGMLSNAMLIPVLPRIAKALDIPFSQTTWLVTALNVTSALVVPFMGFFSDKWTRTVVLVPGLILYGLGGLLAGVAPFIVSEPFSLLLVGRVLQGIGSAGTSVQALALAGDLLEPEKRARVMSMLETSNAAGKALGPLLGAALATIAWYAPFFFFPLTAIPIGIVFWHYLGTMPDPDKERIPFVRYNRGFWQTTRTKIVPLTFTMLAAFMSTSLILLLLTLLSRELAAANIRGLARGALITVPEIVVAVAAFTTAKYLKKDLKNRGRQLILIGMGLFAVSLGGAAWSDSLWFFVAMVNVSGLGSGTILASMNALVANSVPAAERGMATSIYGAFRSLGALGLPLFFLLRNLLGEESIVFWLLCALTLALGVAMFFLLDTRRLLQEAP